MIETPNMILMLEAPKTSQLDQQTQSSHTAQPCTNDALSTAHDGAQQLPLFPTDNDTNTLPEPVDAGCLLASGPSLREAVVEKEECLLTDPQTLTQPEQNSMTTSKDASDLEEPERKIVLPMNGVAIMAHPQRPRTWFGPDFLTPGLGLLTADPKFGKTWMGIDLVLTMAMGGKFLGMTIEQGDALFIGLENTTEENSERAQALWKARHLERSPENLWMYSKEDFDANFLGAGDIVPLKRWIQSASKPQMIVIDTLALFVSGVGGSYMQDNQALHQLRFFAKQHQIMLMFIHHNNKTGKGIRAANGSQALTGNADVILVGNKPNEFASRATLSIMGNAIQKPRQLNMDFNSENLAWQLIDLERDVAQNASRQALLEIMRDQDRPLTPRKLHEAALDACIEPMPSLEVIRQQLMRMHKQNVLGRKPADSGQGYAYYLPDNSESQTAP